jgi:N6-L-threonylcarbamoyladenine synthase
MVTLGIETSCDETSCAVLEDRDVLSCTTLSSLKEHAPYGGVIPEIATRAHLNAIDNVLSLSLKKAKLSLRAVDLIAVTHRPGLFGALVIGLNFAKALSLSLKKPFIGVNHLHAHLFASFLNGAAKVKFPFLGVVVSGGHTELYRVDGFDAITCIGQTRDDACGEAFDKVARAMGLGYPGGPAIDRRYQERYKDAFRFKCGRVRFDLSFSGIKTAVLCKKTQLEAHHPVERAITQKLVSSFQHTVVSAIIETIIDAAHTYRLKRVVCGGGVFANRYLRRRVTSLKGIDFFIPPVEYTGDNAAIVAGLGFYLYNKKRAKSPLTLEAEVN